MNTPADMVGVLSRTLAPLVLCTRKKFGDIYNESIAANDLVGKTKPFLAAILDKQFKQPKEDVVAFERAFAIAIDQQWVGSLLNRGLEEQAFDVKIVDAMNDEGVTPQGANSAETVRPQAIVNKADGLLSKEQLAGIMLVLPKVCHVRVNHEGKRRTGTGFLVGPQTVLTAWHVVEPLIDPATGEQLAGSAKSLKVVFDYYSADGDDENTKKFSVVDQWLGDNSRCPKSEVPSGKGITSNGQPASNADADLLDFAVIRIKGAPGRERGTVKLRDDFVKLPKTGISEIFVFQHPNDFPQLWGKGPIEQFFGNGVPPPRIRHHANTSEGSSGGLCTDAQFKGVALHQAVVLDANDQPIANQAVTAAAIVRKFSSALNFDPQLDPLWELSDTAKSPVIGREDFQESVWKAARGEKRVLLVQGNPRTGMRFSKQILRTLRPSADADIVEIDASEVGQDALALATALLDRMGVKVEPPDKLPTREAAGTAPAGWLSDQLTIELIKRMKAKAGSKEVWIVVSHLNEFDIPEDSAQQLLLKLIRALTAAPFLRFLLLGVENLQLGIPAELVDQDELDWPSTTDIETYLRRYCTAKEIGISEDSLRERAEALADELQNYHAQNQWKAAADILVARIHPKLLESRQP